MSTTTTNGDESNEEQYAEIESLADNHYGWRQIQTIHADGDYPAAWEYLHGEVLLAVKAIDDHGEENYEVFMRDRTGEDRYLARHTRTITLTEAGAYADEWMGVGGGNGC